MLIISKHCKGFLEWMERILKEGNMKYVGFIYLTLAAVVVVLSLLKKKEL